MPHPVYVQRDRSGPSTVSKGTNTFFDPYDRGNSIDSYRSKRNVTIDNANFIHVE
ncbi:hypothetical protein WN55_04725 [Dufourea novaeangliae]|uniref:Uncharacterized protein n=1 Tax=Dufourea novaeangliae TaxID=178035 RepID=A0A154P1I1_DUFNO|nr:hypothetical protein WN55_04725 [Dufourea novaeangliae]